MILDTATEKHLERNFGRKPNNTAKETDYLFISVPEELTENSAYGDLVISVIKKGGDQIPDEPNDMTHLRLGDPAIKFMTKALIIQIVTAGGILSGRPCVGVVVNTTVLDATVPDSYDSPNRDWPAEEGEEPVRKKVRELMRHYEGENGQSVIIAQEIAPGAVGLRHDEAVRFMTYFTEFTVFPTALLTNWIANNMSEG